MDVETIEVVNSEDGGNGLPPEAPSLPTTDDTATTAEGESTPQADAPKTESTPEVELYELPDGRKVDGATLSKEWKENFLPEFTRKSQTLAEIEKSKQVNNSAEKPFENPDWQPQTYAELIEITKQEIRAEQERQRQAAIEEQKAREDYVSAQLNEVKQVDSNVNEEALFQHAIKYGFRDLKAAHQNMRDMSELAKKVQETTVKNIAKRSDPVSMTGVGGAGGNRPNPSQFSTAVEYLRSLGK